MLDKGVEVLGGIAVQRRRQDAAVTQGARPKFHAAMHPSHDTVLGKLRDGRVDGLFRGQDVPEPQLAILEYALDLFRGVTGTQIKVIEADAPGLVVDGMPGIERRAKRRARIPRCRLHENILKRRAFQRGNQQRVQAQPAGQAKAPRARAGHADHRLLDGALYAGRQRSAQRLGHRGALVDPQPLVKARAEAAAGQPLGIEERSVQAGPFAVPHGHDFQKQVAEPVVARAT